jgi:chromosome segregation ATPase
MQKIFKYIIIISIAILIFITGYITGCVSSNRTVADMAESNKELQESLDQYSISNEALISERSGVDDTIRGLNSEIESMGNVISTLTDRLLQFEELIPDFTEGLGSIHGELSDSRQGIQEVTEGLSRIDSELQSYIERSANP